MNVHQAIKDKRSIRRYADKPVEEDKITKVLEAARLSPSASNLQDWKFVVVREKATIARLVDACNGQSFVGKAPVFIAACGTNPGPVMGCGQHRYTVDLSIAMSYLILQAHELGLGTCWLGSFQEDEVKKILGIPEEVRVVAVTPLGYPEVMPRPTSRKNFDEVVSFEKY